MCGIAGLALTASEYIEKGKVRKILHELGHRGPDDAGVLCCNKGNIKLRRVENLSDEVFEVILFHRRLSILDLSEAGWQPMGTRDGKFFIVFNGEIYNYLELRTELETLGYRFNSGSDTEVLLYAFVEWGVQALVRLVGMFAFAFLDIHGRKLFLVRDFFGIKPLYYARVRNGLAFASEIYPLLELSEVSRQVNSQRLYEYLRFGMTDHGGGTLFRDVCQLPPGHYMEISLDNIEVAEPKRYWQVERKCPAAISFEEAAKSLRDLFLKSVSLHFRSDVPVGAALSGGIDSSAIVMALRSLKPNIPLHTFSYIADDPTMSEEQWVDLVGRAGNLVVHKIRPNPQELVEDLDHLIAAQGEPFASTSIYAQRRVFQRAKEQGIKVMLDGQGADEIFGGYIFFIAARFGSLLRGGRWAEAIHLGHNAAKLPGMSWLGLFLRTMDFVIPLSLQKPLRKLIDKDLMPSWLNTQWLLERGVVSKSPGYKGGKNIFKECLYDNFVESSLPHLLRYEDRNSMAFSIESRVPFLTPQLVNFMFSLPEEYFISQDGITKSLFRKAMREIVPNAILDRKDKIGFVTPENDWLLGLHSWVTGVITSETAKQIHILNIRKISQEWEEIVHRGRRSDSHVWRWVNMIVWAEKFAMQFE